MKNRTGFVSNSSSSSFIISAKPDDKGKVLVTLDLSKLGGVIIKTEYDLNNCFIEKYGRDFQKKQDVQRLYERCLEKIINDEAIVMGYIDNNPYEVLSCVSGKSSVLEFDGSIEV